MVYFPYSCRLTLSKWKSDHIVPLFKTFHPFKYQSKIQNLCTQPSISSLEFFLSLSAAVTLVCSVVSLFFIKHAKHIVAVGVSSLSGPQSGMFLTSFRSLLNSGLLRWGFSNHTCPPSFSIYLPLPLHCFNLLYSTESHLTYYTFISLFVFPNRMYSPWEQEVYLFGSQLYCQQLSAHGNHPVNICGWMNLLCKWRDWLRKAIYSRLKLRQSVLPWWSHSWFWIWGFVPYFQTLHFLTDVASYPACGAATRSNQVNRMKQRIEIPLCSSSMIWPQWHTSVWQREPAPSLTSSVTKNKGNCTLMRQMQGQNDSEVRGINSGASWQS